MLKSVDFTPFKGISLYSMLRSVRPHMSGACQLRRVPLTTGAEPQRGCWEWNQAPFENNRGS